MLRRAVLAIVLFAFAASLDAANVDVPSLELFTRGSVSSGTVELATEGEMDIAIEGGVKFGANITLGFNSPALSELST